MTAQELDTIIQIAETRENVRFGDIADALVEGDMPSDWGYALNEVAWHENEDGQYYWTKS